MKFVSRHLADDVNTNTNECCADISDINALWLANHGSSIA